MFYSVQNIFRRATESIPALLLPLPSRRAKLLVLLPILLLTWGLRLDFTLNHSTIYPLHDTTGYWRNMLKSYDFVCYLTQQCSTSDTTPKPELKPILYEAFLSRIGINYLGLGAWQSILNHPQWDISLYIVMALDVLLVAMLFSLCCRLGFSLWGAALVSGLYAVYIPAIVQKASLLQQPWVSFYFMGLVWCLYLSLSAKRGQTKWVSLMAVLLVLLGLSSLGTRLLMIGAAFLIGITLVFHPKKQLLRVYLAVLSGLMLLLFGITLAIIPPKETRAALITAYLGFLENAGETAPLSFDHFWATNDYQLGAEAGTAFSQLRAEPRRFIYWWTYSAVGNVGYADTLYFQVYLLPLAQQQIFHQILMSLGLFGWLLALPRLGWRFWLLLTLFNGYIIAVNALISIESRRIIPILPFVLLGFGYLIELLYRGKKMGWTLLSLMVWGAWWLPWSWIFVFSPSHLTEFTVFVWVGGLGILSWFLGLIWLKLGGLDRWQGAVGALIWGVIIFSVGLYRTEETTWRPWQTTVNSSIKQVITNPHPDPYLLPWILVDIDAANLEAVQVTINGQVVKAAGQPFYRWSAGFPETWTAIYTSEAMANEPPTRRSWLAYPLPLELATAEQWEIEIDPQGQTIQVYGDYLPSQADAYVGPLFTPSYGGQSIWRWQWNGFDPRIPARQALPSQPTSSYWVDNHWETEDLSSSWERHIGTYRVFVVWSPFGTPNNALKTPDAYYTTFQVPEIRCPSNQTPITHLQGLNMCANEAQLFIYESDNTLVATLAAERFQTDLTENALLVEAPWSGGRLHLIYFYRNWVVANFYRDSGELFYSYTLVVPNSWLQKPTAN